MLMIGRAFGTAAFVSSCVVSAYAGIDTRYSSTDPSLSMAEWLPAARISLLDDSGVGMHYRPIELAEDYGARFLEALPESQNELAGAYSRVARDSTKQLPTSREVEAYTGIAAPLAGKQTDSAPSDDTFVFAALSSKLASTPEPASLALLGTGALSAVALLRRRVN